MRQLANHLSADELVLVNEAIKSVMVLTAGYDPERRVFMAVQVAAQITGVTMAIESVPRNIDSARLNAMATEGFETGANRAYLHALDEVVNRPRAKAGEVLADWQDAHLTERAMKPARPPALLP